MQFAVKMARQRDEAVKQAEELSMHLRGALLVQWILLLRLGGDVIINRSELLATRGRVGVAYNKEEDQFRYFAIEPDEDTQIEPAPQIETP